jgi:hypothetical protein
VICSDRPSHPFEEVTEIEPEPANVSGVVGARGLIMMQTSLVSPLEAQFTSHRDAEKRRRETHEWLEQRERELGLIQDAPPVAPGNSDHH